MELKSPKKYNRTISNLSWKYNKYTNVCTCVKIYTHANIHTEKKTDENLSQAESLRDSTLISNLQLRWGHKHIFILKLGKGILKGIFLLCFNKFILCIHTYDPHPTSYTVQENDATAHYLTKYYTCNCCLLKRKWKPPTLMWKMCILRDRENIRSLLSEPKSPKL